MLPAQKPMTTAADSERLFKAGIAAYKASDYERAVAALKPLLRDRSYRLKAGMGLVKVYMSQKEWAEAQKLCKKISQSSQPSVQQWSKETSAKIEKRRTKANIVQPSRKKASPLSSRPAKERSGFVPLQAEVPLLKVDKATPQTNGAGAKKAIGKSGFIPSTPKPPRAEAESPSIFHYAYLNDEVERDRSVNARKSEPDPTSPKQPSSWETAASNPADTQWRYTGRLKQGRSLGRTRTGKLWTAQIIGGIGFYLLARLLLNRAISTLNGYLNFLSGLPLLGWIKSIPIYDATWQLLSALAVVAIASPWLWDIWLRVLFNRQPFSLNELRPRCAEAATLISQRCRQRRWPLPKLWRLSTDMPLIFSYGWLPRNARLIISDGLINQLEADELATLVASEIAQWKSLHWPLLSVSSLVLQLFHQAYWQLALWGNRQSHALNLAAGLLSTISYCAFWLLRIPLLWVARVKTYFSDRAACELTGNPNGLTRALGKVSFQLASAIEAQGYTPAFIESAALLLPVSPDLARYKLYGQYPLGQLYAWDCLNPIRNWMSLLDARPPLGDRFSLIAAYARHWKLEPELALPASKHQKRQQRLRQQDWLRLLQQATPYLAAVIGLGLGLALLGIGAIAYRLEWPFLDWMHQDAGLFWCCILLSTGVGSILRINRFFPNLSFNSPLSTDWPSWLSEFDLLPVESLPTHLSGTVIGRPGLANWLGQDLLLQTTDGLLKLHFFSAVGPLGNCLRLGDRPALPLGKTVQLLGWFRRGNQPWIDVDKIRLSNGLIVSAAHPIFSLAIALICAGLGLWLLIQSG